MATMAVDKARGAAIAAWRNALGLSQRSAASQVGVTNTTWARWEQGFQPAGHLVPAVESVLGVSLDQIGDGPTPISSLDDLRDRVRRLERVVDTLTDQVELLQREAIDRDDDDGAPIRRQA